MNGQRQQTVTGEYAPDCPVNSNTFPGKLWKLVNDEQYQSIRWTNGGTTIGIDAHKFKYEILARNDMAIFKTKNFSSFVRQLNLYGFRKITAVHQGSRIYEYPQNQIHAHHQHHHQQVHTELQHFQHSCFDQSHPELLIRVRRASAAQKRKAQEEAELNGHLFNGLGLRNSNTGFGILRDTTNLYNSKFRGKAFPVSLIANHGKIFGLSLIASASPGSLIATPATAQNVDFSKLCNKRGQLRKYVVIGRQDAHCDGPMLFNDDELSTPPVLKAYSMSPVGNPSSSVGHALTEAPLDTSISEAESAVSFLLNETFESARTESPEPLSSWQQQQASFDEDIVSKTDNLQSSSSTTSGLSSSDDTTASSSCSTSGTSRSSISSDPPSFYHTSSSSFNSSGPFSSSSSVSLSRSTGSFSSSGSLGFSRSGSSSASSGYSMPTSSFGSSRSGSMFQPPPPPTSSTSSRVNQGINIISHAFMNATQELVPQQGSMSQESSMMEIQMPMMEEEQLAAPLPPSPVDFSAGLMHAASSTPIFNMGRPICTVPNCQCHLAPGPPRFPPSQPMPIFMQGVPMKPC